MKELKLFTRKTKQSSSLKKTLRFNPLIAVAIVVVVGGLGAWTLRESFADTSGVVRVRAYSVANGSQVPLSGVNGLIQGMQTCSGQLMKIPVSTNASGLFTYQYNTNCQGADVYFCMAHADISKSGHSIISSSVDAGNPAPAVDGACGSIAANPTPLLSFTLLLAPHPTLTFNASSGSITSGNSTTLNWSSNHATTCSATAGGINISGAKSGSVSVKPTQTTTYSIKCDKSGTPSVTKSVTVSVTAPPATGTKKPTNSTTPKKPQTNTPTTPSNSSTDTTAPETPKNLQVAMISENTALISWDAATDNIATTSYLLERSADASTWDTITKDLMTASYEDTTISLDTTSYFYRVYAKDAAGNQSQPSTTIELFTAEGAGGQEDPSAAPEEERTENLEAKNSSAAKIFGILGLLVLILGGAVAFWRYRRRQVGSQYDYDQSVQYSQPTTPQAPIAPTNPSIDPPAPHTSRSLKDMVLEDYDPNRHDGPPPPPPSHPGQQ